MTANAKVILAAADSIDETESLPRLLCYGLQHVLVMYAGTVAVPLILGSALQFTPRQVIVAVSVSMGVLPIASPQLFAQLRIQPGSFSIAAFS